MSFISELERLKEKATNGPWLVSHDGDYSLLYVSYPAQGIKLPIAEVYSNMQETDANTIALLRNHANEIAELVKAAEKAMEAMNVWVNTYAPELCEKDHVSKSRKIINEVGGTLAYIADVNEHIHNALAALDKEKP